METEDINPALQPTDHPLWRHALRVMCQTPDFGYGWQRPTSWFEHELGCASQSTEFAFGMLELRAELEAQHGYYLESQTIRNPESDMARLEVWQIPSAADHEEVGKSLEARMRRCANRALNIRVKTLANPKASLTDEERRHMDKSAQIAATRLVLLRREQSVAKLVSRHKPKLLSNE